MPEFIRTILNTWIPRGERLSTEAFAERHRILTGFLVLHLPLLAAFGLWMGQAPLHVAMELAAPIVLAGIAMTGRLPQRLRGVATTAGLVYASAVLVHFSGGTIEAHFHFFVILGFIALYQDWATFAWAIVFTLVSHGVMGTIDPRSMYNHEAAVNGPWKWALIHAAAVAVAALGQLLHWRFAELERARSADLSAHLVQEKHRSSLARLYINLARRNRGLLGEQLAAIDALEAQEHDPDTLERLFRLDHVTSRLRRHTDSLLVLADQPTSRSWSGPVSLADVVRAAAGDVEDYQRVDVTVSHGTQLSGHVVADVTHVLTELIENALSFSPPDKQVVIASHPVPSGVVVVIRDHGLGMDAAVLEAVNERLRTVTTLEDGLHAQLGLHVVARLAAKHGIRVQLEPGRDGGIMALVLLPAPLHAANGTPTATPAAAPSPTPAHAPAPDLPAAPANPVRTRAATATATLDLAPPTGAAPPAMPVPSTAPMNGQVFTARSGTPDTADAKLPRRVPGNTGAAPGAAAPIQGLFGGSPPQARDAADDDPGARHRQLSAFQAATRQERS